MRVHFHGAAGEVTGSLHEVEAAGQRVLPDRGMRSLRSYWQVARHNGCIGACGMVERAARPSVMVDDPAIQHRRTTPRMKSKAPDCAAPRAISPTRNVPLRRRK